jgi:hypothetical protein
LTSPMLSISLRMALVMFSTPFKVVSNYFANTGHHRLANSIAENEGRNEELAIGRASAY